MTAQLDFAAIAAPDAPDWRRAKNLWLAAFPENERADADVLEKRLTFEPDFRAWAIRRGREFAGVFFWWDFETFAFCEHFAVVPSLRDRGLGSKFLNLARSTLSVPLILEIEPLLTDLARRRLNFYRRAGFEIIDRDYAQPPYREGDSFAPMLLLGADAARLNPDIVKNTIYNRVYGLNADF